MFDNLCNKMKFELKNNYDGKFGKSNGEDQYLALTITFVNEKFERRNLTLGAFCFQERGKPVSGFGI